MASIPITSWQRDGEKMETVISFIFLGSKTTVDSDCSHEIKTLAPWKKSYNKAAAAAAAAKSLQLCPTLCDPNDKATDKISSLFLSSIILLLLLLLSHISRVRLCATP